MLCSRRVLAVALRRRHLAAAPPPRPPDALERALAGDTKTPRDWRALRSSLLGLRVSDLDERNVDGRILGRLVDSGDSASASAYLRFMDEERLEWGLSTFGRYFRLVRLSPEPLDEAAVLRRYDELRRRYPVLDPITLEAAVAALSLTSRWRLCLGLLDEIRVAGAPRGAATAAVVCAAFENGDDGLAWRLLAEAIEHDDRTPDESIFLTYIKVLRRCGDNTTVMDKLGTLFEFCREHDLKLPESAALDLIRLYRSLGRTGVAFITVGRDGSCRNCRARLERLELGDDEFDRLKSEVLDRVIVGRDVFVKSDPAELEAFKRLIGSGKRYDVIVDGLNVAYSAGTKQPPRVLAAMLAGVVSHFAGKRILVFGRLHMSRLPGPDWDYVNRHADVFLARNLSQDDPYLLYSALSSGRDVVVVTRDRMRGHKSLLAGPRLRATFDRWLSQRRYELARLDGDRPTFRSPPEFTSTAQKSRDTWHVPYAKGAEGPQEHAQPYHKYWMCLKS